MKLKFSSLLTSHISMLNSHVKVRVTVIPCWTTLMYVEYLHCCGKFSGTALAQGLEAESGVLARALERWDLRKKGRVCHPKCWLRSSMKTLPRCFGHETGEHFSHCLEVASASIESCLPVGEGLGIHRRIQAQIKGQASGRAAHLWAHQGQHPPVLIQGPGAQSWSGNH